jgi:hypothetical protein
MLVWAGPLVHTKREIPHHFEHRCNSENTTVVEDTEIGLKALQQIFDYRRVMDAMDAVSNELSELAPVKSEHFASFCKPAKDFCFYLCIGCEKFRHTKNNTSVRGSQRKKAKRLALCPNVRYFGGFLLSAALTTFFANSSDGVE